MLFYRAVLSINGYTGKISHMLIRACKLIKKRGLTTILISCESKSENHIIRQRIFIFLCVVPSTLPETRVFFALLLISLLRAFNSALLFYKFFKSFFAFFSYIVYKYLLRVCQPDCKLVAVYPHFHWVAHRRQLYHCHIRPRYNSHIEKMLSERSFATDFLNSRGFSYFKFS